MTASKQVAIFLVIITVAANIINFSGVGAALDIDPRTQGQEEVDRVNETASQVQPTQGTRDTLFSLFTSMGSLFLGIVNIVFAAPLMFENLGVPWWLTTFFFAPMVIIVAADVMHVLTGRNP